MNSLVLVVVLGVVSTLAQQRDFVKEIRRCRETQHLQLNECLKAEINLLGPRLAAGVPAPGLPQLEPLALKNIVFKQSEPPVTIEAVFSDVLVYGLSRFTMQYIDVDFSEQRRISLGITIPKLEMTGNYRIRGNLFVLPIQGSGPFRTTLDSVIAEGIGDIIAVPGNRVKLGNLHIGFKVRRLNSTLENLFEGNQVLSDTIHHFLNENGQLVLDEIRPGITMQLNEFVLTLFNTIFDQLPTDVLQPIPNANNRDAIRQQQLLQQQRG